MDFEERWRIVSQCIRRWKTMILTRILGSLLWPVKVLEAFVLSSGLWILWRKYFTWFCLREYSVTLLLSQHIYGQSAPKSRFTNKASVLQPTSTIVDEAHAWMDTAFSSQNDLQAPEWELSPRSSLKRTRRSSTPRRRVRSRLNLSEESSAQDIFKMSSTTGVSSVTSLYSRRKLKPTS